MKHSVAPVEQPNSSIKMFQNHGHTTSFVKKPVAVVEQGKGKSANSAKLLASGTQATGNGVDRQQQLTQ